MLWHQAATCDLLFITLRKSEALFSPSTRTRDLALGPCLFPWESQSTTTVASATGQRTIHHEARGSRVLLYRFCASVLRATRATRASGRWREAILGWWLEREIPAAWLPVMALAV